MPIRQDDNQPNRRFGIVNIILIGVGALLLFSSLFPNQNMQIPRVPYSLFIDQVNDGEVKRAYITQEQIRYELNGAEEGAPSVLATTPIFDMDLPQRLESKGVEFAAAPPKKPNFFTTILTRSSNQTIKHWNQTFSAFKPKSFSPWISPLQKLL